jgi:hypothetical protein
MKKLLIVLLVLAFALPALADQNPYLAIFLDSDNDTGTAPVTQICPPPNAAFDVYVCFDRFGPAGDGVGGGMLGAAFMFERTFGGFKLAQTNLLGGLDFGDVEAGGWAITAGANCVFPDATGIVIAASVSYLYLGVPGTITILAHPVDGPVGSDCDNLLDTWCVPSTVSHQFDGHFGVCMAPPSGDCEPISPVEDATWGAIKSLYR